MAKSGQKRAFEDEIVQDVLPKEELTVHNREGINYAYAIDAAANKPGMWFSPEAWADMADISNTVHDTRRSIRANESQLNTIKMQDDLTYYYKLEEDRRKREASSLVVDENMVYNEDLQAALETAKRTGVPTRDVVAEFHNRYLDR